MPQFVCTRTCAPDRNYYREGQIITASKAPCQWFEPYVVPPPAADTLKTLREKFNDQDPIALSQIPPPTNPFFA
jgi:hypothetical protein